MNPTILSSKAAAASASSSPAVVSSSEASAVSFSDMHSASTAIFAADELDGVFRIGSTIHSTQSQLIDPQARENSVRRRRFNSASFATDGELSTFSEEDNDGSDEIQENINSEGIHQSLVQNSRRNNIFYPSLDQRSPLSIFRLPIRGTKRQCHVLTIDNNDMMADDDDDETQDQVNSTPLLSRANRICSNDESSDDDSTSSSSEEFLDHLMSTPSSKRICLSKDDSPSSYISLFSVTSPATIDYRGADSVIITPRKLEHPLASRRTLIES
jgi:hypothetical protein